MTRYFPEVVDALKTALPPRCVVDGEIVLVDPARGGLDFELLQLRLHPAASRVGLLAQQTPASFVAFDLLALGDDDLTGMPFADRRARLETVLADAAPHVHLTPMTDDPVLAARWFTELEGAGLDGIVAKAPDLAYQQDKRVMTKVKHERTADCVVAGYRPHTASPDVVGSLMLGVYRDDGTLASIGVIGAFPMTRRRALVDELAPYVTQFEGHPWDWAAHVADLTPAQRRGAGSRWNAGKDLSFVPLRPELVVEARYDYLEGGRFRHTAQFVRWRPDRDPLSCRTDQFERPLTYDLRDLLALP
jgi:ATP-dependent DNA ligase